MADGITGALREIGRQNPHVHEAVNIAADEIILLRERLLVRDREVHYLGEQLETAREALAVSAPAEGDNA